MNKINTVVIPIAGKGTRFLPVTKSLTKTMFPIINKPVLHYLIEEGIRAGINRFIFIINNEQTMIKDYLDLKSEYYNNLNKEFNELNELNSLIKNIEIKYIIQEKPLGLGHAILLAEDYILDDAFGVILGDDLVLSNSSKYGIYDLIKNYQIHNGYYLGIKEVKLSDTSKYGIVALKNKQVTKIVEKPLINPPSNLAVVGRYILKRSIFKYLKDLPLNENKELQLTDAISNAIKYEKVYGINFNGIRFDIGSHEGYTEAIIYASLQNQTINSNILEYLNNLDLNDFKLSTN